MKKYILAAAVILSTFSTSGYCDCLSLAADRQEKCLENHKGDSETMQKCNNNFDAAAEYCNRRQPQQFQQSQGRIVVPQQQPTMMPGYR